jgi:uncharacterized circularly permuted ATP-grasp superfamily protein
VETYLCSRPDDLRYTLAHLPELVVKAVGESGGYGMLIGPASDEKTIEEFRAWQEGTLICVPTACMTARA